MTNNIRLPPQNLDAERSVIGSVLLLESAFDEVADTLKPNHFYSDAHQIIYATICRMKDEQRTVDAVTLGDELEERQQLGNVGGAAYLAELMETVPHAAHAKHYASIVRDRWVQRSVAGVATEILEGCYDTSDDTDEILRKAEQGLFSIFEQQDSDCSLWAGDLMSETLDRINTRMQAGAISGVASGFVDLDRLTNGFQGSELIIVAARPSMGKTALVCNIAEWVADAGQTGTIVFSLEQSKHELLERFICIRSRLDGHKVRKGTLGPDERMALVDASSEIGRLPLYIDDRPGKTVSQIAAICRRLKRRNQLGLVIIDYLQLIEPEDKRANREQQIAQITRRLKGIAKENEVPVIALAQLNRGVELREDKRPRLADLRESGAIEQDADVVCFLHRPDMYNAEDRPGLAEVIVAKHRSGPVGIVNLQWRKESMRFEGVASGSEATNWF